MGSMTGPTGPSAGTSGRLPGLLEELHRTGRVSSPPSRRSRLSSAALLLFALVAATGAVGTCVLGIRDGRLEDAIGGAIGSVFMLLFVGVAAHGLRIRRPGGPLTLTISAAGIRVSERTIPWGDIADVRAQRLQVPGGMPALLRVIGGVTARGSCLAVSLTDEGVARLRSEGTSAALDRVFLPGRVLQLGIGGAVSPEDLAVLAMEARALR